jgi:hypothetical protein
MVLKSLFPKNKIFMRSILTFFLIIFSFSVEAQTIFESSEMVITSNGKIETIDYYNKIVINSDTTEIEIKSKNIHTKEKIHSLLTVFNEETHDVLVYKKENDEILVLYTKNGIIYSILIQTDMDNFITFN